MSRAGRAAFERALREIYDLEVRLQAALPKMASAAGDKQLTKILENHARITAKQRKRLEKVFDQVKKEPRRKESSTGSHLIERFVDETSRGTDTEKDLRAILIAMQLEHLEMAAYAHLMKLAQEEGLKRAVSQLEKNSGEEEKAAQDLEDLIESIAGQGSSSE